MRCHARCPGNLESVARTERNTTSLTQFSHVVKPGGVTSTQILLRPHGSGRRIFFKKVSRCPIARGLCATVKIAPGMVHRRENRRPRLPRRRKHQEPQGHALRPRVQHAPQVDPVRRFASRTHVRLGRTLGGRERERVMLRERATGGEGAASHIVNWCAVDTKSDRQQAQAGDGHGPQWMSLLSVVRPTACDGDESINSQGYFLCFRAWYHVRLSTLTP